MFKSIYFTDLSHMIFLMREREREGWNMLETTTDLTTVGLTIVSLVGSILTVTFTIAALVVATIYGIFACLCYIAEKISTRAALIRVRKYESVMGNYIIKLVKQSLVIIKQKRCCNDTTKIRSYTKFLGNYFIART